MRWCIFLQPIGLRPLVQADRRRFVYLMEQFRTVVVDACKRRKRAARALLLPTAAFIHSDQPDALIYVLAMIREDLNKLGIFLRGVVERADGSEFEQEDLLPTSSTVALLEARCEQQKAIGFDFCGVHEDLTQAGHRFVHSVYFRTSGGPPSRLVDIPIAWDPLTSEVVFEKLYRGALDALHGPGSVEHFYPPAMITWIQSVDLLVDRLDKGATELLGLACRRTYRSDFGRVRGIDYVFYSAMLRLAECRVVADHDTATPAGWEELYYSGIQILSSAKFEQGFRSAPDWLGPTEARQTVLEDLLQFRRRRSVPWEVAIRREIISRRGVANLADGQRLERVASQIAQALTSLGLRIPPGRQPTAKGVMKFCEEHCIPLTFDEMVPCSLRWLAQNYPRISEESPQSELDAVASEMNREALRWVENSKLREFDAAAVVALIAHSQNTDKKDSVAI